MNVGVITNVGEACGIAQYGEDLIRELGVHFAVNTLKTIEEYDVVIVNWHPAKVNLDVILIERWQAAGCKVIVLVHNSSEGMVVPYARDILATADAVVAHEPVEFRGNVKRFQHIELGIPEVDVQALLHSYSIGTAGFAFAHRQFDMVVDFAEEFNMLANIICPPYPCHIDPDELEKKWLAKLGTHLHMIKTFMPREFVVKTLANSLMNIFWFESQKANDDLGQSGSVRMGIAAQRPVILSRSRKFRTLFPYEDELYFCNNREEAHRAVEEILKTDKPRIPKRVMQDQAWSRVALDWVDLIEEVAA
jgi:hypothetical protein